MSSELLSDSSAFDLDAYLARIGYTGPREATFAVLEDIHRRHPEAIPFENVNPLVGWPVALDTRSLQQKLVAGGRGGYCFEQNLLLAHALDALGFRVSGLAARVLYNAAPGVTPARTHMLLTIELGRDTFVADVGFGGTTLTGPLKLVPNVEQRTPHEPFRLVAADNEFVMEARFSGRWVALYRFDLQPQVLADYEVANWYLSHAPTSRFVTNLIAARTTADRRYALANNVFATHWLDGRTERQAIADVRELRGTLEGVFHLRLPRAPEVDAALERVLSRPVDANHPATV